MQSNTNLRRKVVSAFAAALGLSAMTAVSNSSLAQDLGSNLPPITTATGALVNTASFEPFQDYVSPASCNSPSASALTCPSISCSTATECSPCTPCTPCRPWWAHRNGFFGEALYLSPGNSDLIYAVEQTDTTTSASPTGPLGIANIGESVGYRVGFSCAKSDCASTWVSYARWDGNTTSTLDATGTNVLRSTLIHPSTATVGSDSLQSVARQMANFQTVDVAMRRLYRANNCGALNWNAGLRYGNVEQGLSADQTISVATGLTNVLTDIDFNGLGILGGLDGTRFNSESGLLVYGKAFGSLLAGDWKANYRQRNQFGGGVIANNYTDFRVTPVVDTEIGVGWQSCSGNCKVTTGYLFSTWFNTVTTRDYIQSVRTANLLNLDDNLTFSGLTARLDFNF